MTTQKELIARIAQETGLPKTAVGDVFNRLAEAVTEGLADDADEVTLPGIGTLSTAQRAARKGRNPATGEEVDIPARVAVTFRPAKALRDAVNAA